MDESKAWDILRESKILQREEKLNEIIPNIRKALKYCKTNNLNSLHFEFASVLYYFYTMVSPDKKISSYAFKEIETARFLRGIEEKAREGYIRIDSQLQSKRQIDEKLKIELDIYCGEMIRYIELDNLSISLYIYPLLCKKYYADRDYQKVIKQCESAITFYENRKTNKAQHFRSMMLPALIIRKEYDKVDLTLKRIKVQKNKQSYSASVHLFYRTLNQLHSKRYTEAYQGIIKADRNEQVNPLLREQWYIVKGFVQVLSNAGLIKNTKRFRLSKILNEIPNFTKDKRGNFINVLILKIILGLQENRGDLIQSKESLESAYHRYPEKGSREHLFLRMLLRIISMSFDKDKIIKSSAKDLAKLKELEMRPESIDIVPWLNLWDIIVKELN